MTSDPAATTDTKAGPSSDRLTVRDSWRDAPASLWMLLGGLALNIFSGNWGLMNIPLGPDRLLIAAGLLLLLLDPRIPRPRPRALYAAMLVFGAWTVTSLVLVGDFSTGPVFAALDRVIMPFVLFATAPMILRTSTERLVFLRTMTLLGLYLAVTAIFQAAGLHSLVFPGYITDTTHVDGMPVADAARAGGPFLAGEANGMALGLCGVLAFLLARLDRGGWRALGLLTGALAGLASILSLTRSVWLGVFLAAVVVIASRPALWRWLPMMGIVALLLSGAGVAAVPSVVENIADRGMTSRSLYDRQNSNAAALRAIHEHPVAGVGWARFGQVGSDWVRQGEDYPVTTVDIEVHNVVLSRAVDLGLPAAGLFVGILLFGPVAAVTRRRADPVEEDWRLAGLAATCVWFVPAMVSPIPYPFPSLLYFTIAGLLYALPFRSSMSADTVSGTEEVATRP
ncbi:O-antigen ligase family protein [Mobilicoccus sp.]|uniref:O-antigen ligase family protein n=1 Tax=Mobilicoccus sp. TaxID=2034349 RepID=UPI0028B1E551|nr:O-antigen ligase family protein [Mobilicoccus sp.]